MNHQTAPRAGDAAFGWSDPAVAPWSVGAPSALGSIPSDSVEGGVGAAIDALAGWPALTLAGLALVALVIGLILERRRHQHALAALRASSEQRARERDVELEAARHTLAVQLRQAQKRESLGRLTGGVAHDFNNLLTVIFGYSEVLTRKLEHAQIQSQELVEIQRAAERAADLTRQLLMFGRAQAARPRVVELDPLVRTVERLLHRVIGEQVELAVFVNAPGAMVLVDANQMEQVLVNLAVNARDAMPDGGRLTISTELDEASAAVQPRSVTVHVTDTGHGIAPEHLDRIFEPFFTTKAEGFGTGLGLATVAEIVKQAGGEIAVESKPNHGTTFRLTLPVHAGTALPPAALPHSVDANGRETVLVVEDETSVRSVFAGELRRHGYTVLEASNGEDALRTALRFRGPIDALVTDLVMPRMGGAELAQRLVAHRPGLRVLFASGYGNAMQSTERLTQVEKVFLTKPFVPAELSRSVRQLLDRVPNR